MAGCRRRSGGGGLDDVDDGAEYSKLETADGRGVPDLGLVRLQKSRRRQRVVCPLPLAKTHREWSPTLVSAVN